MTRARSALRRFGELWVAAGVALSSATQFRPAGFPLGLGEVMLLVWALVNGAVLLLGMRVWSAPMTRALMRFWAVALPTLLAGTVAGIVAGVGPSVSVWRDLMAFGFLVLLLFVFTSLPELERRSLRLSSDVTVLAVVPLFILLGFAILGITAGPIDPWYGFRFRGWAQNPNQLALAMSVLPFFALRMAGRARTGAGRAACAVLFVGAVLVGVASASDALVASWVLGAAIYIPLLWRSMARESTRSYLRAATLRVAVPLVALGLLGVASVRMSTALSGEVAGVYEAGGQGSLRVHLWGVGLQAMIASPVVGLGPGGHAGEGPFQGDEAHNTLIDWGASSGLVGVAAYLILLGWLLIHTWRNGGPLMGVALISLVAFSALHFVLRHPIYWFSLIGMASSGGIPPAGGSPNARRGTRPRPLATAVPDA